jgi:hypothetical protein
MTDINDPLASANAFVRNAFIITPWTTMAEVRRLFPNLKACDGYWGARVHQSLASDRLYIGMKMEADRIFHWAVYMRCPDPETFTSTQASIASQLNHRLGKADERWDGENARHRTFQPNPAERVRFHRRSGADWGEGITLILSRKFTQPVEQLWRPATLDDLAS